jgi:hypothetical protein
MVYPGCGKSLCRELVDATWFHGKDGLSDRDYPTPHRKAEAVDATEAIINTIEASPGVVLVTLWPLTNIARGILREPNTVQSVIATGAQSAQPLGPPNNVVFRSRCHIPFATRISPMMTHRLTLVTICPSSVSL